MKKKNIIITIIVIAITVGCGFLLYAFNAEDKESTLTLSEKTWIENNKNNIIDLGVINNIAILNYSGKGLFFDFIEAMEEDTGLDFNKISYEIDEKNTNDYSFKKVDNIGKNEILIYSDNYVLIGNKNNKYNNLDDIKEGTVGVLEDNLSDTNKYLNNENLLYKSYEDVDSLIEDFTSEDTKLTYIILPKLLFISNLEDKEDGLYINYNITEMKDNYVLKLGDEKILNNIIKKYYKKWSSEKFNDEFATHFTNMYFTIHKVDEKDKVRFRSKRYVYGFVENAPYDIEINNKLLGINSEIIKKFSELSNVEISYQGYSNTKKLFKAFNENKVDFYFNSYSNQKFNTDVYKTVSTFDEQIVILSKISNNVVINSVKSLRNYKVSVIENSKIHDELLDQGIKVETYKNINSLLNSLNNDSIVAVDKVTYDFYKNKEFLSFNTDLVYNLNDDYEYIVRDIKNNEVFEEFFNYYLSFVNEAMYTNEGYYKVVSNTSNTNILKAIVISIIALLIILVILILGSKFRPNKPKKRKINMKKEDKLKYIDMLTSLKNRNYLNERIEIWDESEVYPQSIIIVDLNNIAYINDNYGHQEGDNVIKQAASILITNQIPNSDIIRTNGNEFLIYLVEYDEKKVVSYIKKLNKEFKELSHGFGAAIGYSMITDGIKTIDDAVNEATLDMRNNKEELNN